MAIEFGASEWRGSRTYKQVLGAHAQTSRVKGYVASAHMELNARGILGVLKELDWQDLEKKAVKKELRAVMKDAKKEVTKGVRGALPKDPRRTASAVKVLIYKGGKKSATGANLSFYSPRKKPAMGAAPSRRKGGASGIVRNRPKSDATIRMEQYRGASRSMVLRWLDAGVDRRDTGSYKSSGASPYMKKRAARGAIAPRNFFDTYAPSAMERATNALSSRLLALMHEVSGV